MTARRSRVPSHLDGAMGFVFLPKTGQFFGKRKSEDWNSRELVP